MIADLFSGQYKNPVRVSLLHAAEKWSQDVARLVAQGPVDRQMEAAAPDFPGLLQ